MACQPFGWRRCWLKSVMLDWMSRNSVGTSDARTESVIPAAGLGPIPPGYQVGTEGTASDPGPSHAAVRGGRAAEGGVEEVIIVTAPGKEGIASYFQPSETLERDFGEWRHRTLEKVLHASRLANVSFVIQEEALGLGTPC